MARGELIGVRLSPEDERLLDRIIDHLKEKTGVEVTRQEILRAGLHAYANTIPSMASPRRKSGR